MYVIHNSEPLDDPKEVSKAFVSYVSSTAINDIVANLPAIPRPTD